MNKRELKDAREKFKEQSRFIARCTLDSLQKENAHEKEERIKRLLIPDNYADFFDYYFGLGTPIPMADSRCAPFHTEWLTELYDNPVLTQFRRAFRGGAKSIHSNLGHPFHLKQNGQNKFTAVVGANELRGKLLLADLQVQFANNARIIDDFGTQMSYGDWADGMFETTDGAYFMGMGIDQPFRGLRKYANRLYYAVVDDVEDRKKALNEELVRERGDKVLGDLGAAFSKDIQRLVIANNMITNNGLIAYLLNKIGKSPYTRDHKINIVDAKGKPTWERFTPKDVAILKAKNDYYTWEREYMNNPIEEGRIIKEKWLRYVKLPPLHEMELILGHWDLSYKTDGDYKAYALIGAWKGKLYLIDVFCRQCGVTAATNWHYDRKRERNNIGIGSIEYYDATAAQEEVFRPVWQATAAAKSMYEIPLPDQTQHADKHLRIEATLVNVLMNGTLLINEDLKENPDWATARNQLLSFQKGTRAHDDFPDTLERAVAMIQTNYMWGVETCAPIIGKRKVKGY
jgi:predicted phage terminase large subunit-like protein